MHFPVPQTANLLRPKSILQPHHSGFAMKNGFTIITPSIFQSPVPTNHVFKKAVGQVWLFLQSSVLTTCTWPAKSKWRCLRQDVAGKRAVYLPWQGWAAAPWSSTALHNLATSLSPPPSIPHHPHLTGSRLY